MTELTMQALNAARQRHLEAGNAREAAQLGEFIRRGATFASDRQRAFFADLVKRAEPKPAKAAAPKFPRVHALVSGANGEPEMTLHGEGFKITTFSSGAVGIVSPVFGMGVFAIIEADGTLRQRAGFTEAMAESLARIEANPLEEAIRIGKATGRCCVCGIKLTNPESVERGIGPVCAERF